ncbi:MAG: amidohydrolase family protein [Verrucomicrobiae bacterium]|nr:amidohydrolase family protein [Verrucomicrobiae bacterium]NNJ44251.1 amidohydrolase family protein [Akkermansiaceae bacterium]
MKIDSHQHFWAINDTDYGWMGEEHGTIRRDFLPSDLAPLLVESGIDGCVAVQARQMMEETRWLLSLAEQNDLIHGVVGWVPLLESAVGASLEEFASHPKLVGVRHVVHDEPDDNFILREDFNAGIKQLSQHGLVYDILIFAKHLSQTIRFVDRHPEQVFVVDHIAKPCIQDGQFDLAWAAGIRELAQRENVSCKVSGMITEVRGDKWDVDLLRPYFETIIDAFGPQRVMFGSDWPVCLLRGSYQAWAESVAEMSSALSSSEQAAIWGGNAAEIYGL